MSENVAQQRTTLFRVNDVLAVWWDTGLKFTGAMTTSAVEYLRSDAVWMLARRPPGLDRFLCVLMGNEQRAITRELELTFALYPSAFQDGSPIHTVEKEFGFNPPQGWVNPVVDEQGHPIGPDVEIRKRQSKAEQALMVYARTGETNALFEQGLLQRL